MGYFNSYYYVTGWYIGWYSISLFYHSLAIGIVICVLSKSKLADFIASLFLIAAYGFAAPTAPTVMSVFFHLFFYFI